jgi:uncharacterized protein (TIGR02246 family)
MLIAVSAGIVGSSYLTNCVAVDAATRATKTSSKTAIVAQGDPSAIKNQISALSSSLVSGDGKSVAFLWTEDGSYTDSDGNVVQGRDAIEKRFSAQFRENGKPAYELTPQTIRFLSATVAESEGTVRRKEGPSTQPETRYSMVFVKQHGDWLIASATETAITATELTSHETLADLSWLIGAWKAERNGATARMKAEWASDKNFIRCTYEIKKPDQPLMVDFQVIGWDPLKNQIVSWLFNSNGGVGHGAWYRKGSKWIVESDGVERDGSTCVAINVIEPTDPNTFVWESLNRSVDGIALGDTLPLKIERIVQ